MSNELLQKICIYKALGKVRKAKSFGKGEKSPIRVLIVIGTLEIGGAEKHVAKLASSLRDYQITVSICALSAAGALESDLIKKGITLFYPSESDEFRLISKIKFLRGLASYFGSAWTFLRAYNSFRPNIVHFFLPGAYIIGGLTSLFVPGLRRVMSRRSLNIYQRGRPVLTLIERFLHTRMDTITGNSKSVIKDLAAEGVPPDKLNLIYNSVSVPNHFRNSKKSYAEPVEILCIANLIPYKGHLDLFEALARIPKVVSWHLTCVGRDDNYRTELEFAILRLGLVNFVDFTGAVLDPSPYLLSADIGVNCSHQEGFSNALLEYMAAGLGIVATDVGGNTEAIRHRLDGLIIPSRSPLEMSTAIIKLFACKYRNQLGASARRRAIDNFGEKECVNSYSNIYRELYQR